MMNGKSDALEMIEQIRSRKKVRRTEKTISDAAKMSNSARTRKTHIKKQELPVDLDEKIRKYEASKKRKKAETEIPVESAPLVPEIKIELKSGLKSGIKSEPKPEPQPQFQPQPTPERINKQVIPVSLDTCLDFLEQKVYDERKACTKIMFDLYTRQSFIAEGKSGAGKTHTIVNVLDMLPNHAYLPLYGTDEKAFLDRSDEYKGKILFMNEFTIVVKGSGRAKDILIPIANHEIYYDPSGKSIEAEMLVCAAADQNKYKKQYIEKNVELMRRLHQVKIKLTKTKVERIIKKNNRKQKQNIFRQDSKNQIDEQQVKDYTYFCYDFKMNQKKFCNPFVDFVSEYILNSVTENSDLVNVHKMDKVAKNYILGSLTHNFSDREYNHLGENGFIVGFEDVYIAKVLLDDDIQKQGDFDWQACWESSIETLVELGYPASIISEYKNRHIHNGEIRVYDPFDKKSVILAEAHRKIYSASTALIKSTASQKNIFEKDESNSKYTAPNSQKEPETIDEVVESSLPAVVNSYSSVPEIIDADFEVKEEAQKGMPYKEHKAIPDSGFKPPVVVKKSYQNKSLGASNIKYIECKNDAK